MKSDDNSVEILSPFVMLLNMELTGLNNQLVNSQIDFHLHLFPRKMVVIQGMFINENSNFKKLKQIIHTLLTNF